MVDETYVKLLGKRDYLYRGIDQDGQVLDCRLSRSRDPAAAEAFCRRTIASTGCTLEHVVIDKATFYSSAIRMSRTESAAHGHWLLQPGDLDQSLRVEPRLREVGYPAHAQSAPLPRRRKGD